MLGGADNTAIALAEHIAASEQEFVGLMNEKAKQLGLKNTFFANVWTALPMNCIQPCWIWRNL